ncbi:MAG: RimK family alpha-L-glutamate ligase [Spirochaetota bacterium]|nr:MAG: RimK family alpha-L-glutamate ligase [Spirochaetota bacterium]
MKSWILINENKRNSYSTKRFEESAKICGLRPKIVIPRAFDIIATKAGDKSIRYKGKQIEIPDCIIPRMGSGTTYFALAVIRHLEKQGVLILNSSLSIETAKDKLATMQILAANNIPIPKTMLAKFPLNIELVEQEFHYPLVLKTVSGSHGKGVFFCENKSQLKDIADLMEVSKDSKVNVIIQEFVLSSRGKDIRVLVIGGRPIGAMVRIAKKDSYKANFSTGGAVKPFEMNPTIEWLAVESVSLLGLDIAGVDILFNNDSYSICEINSSPEFEGFEKATGIDVPSEIYQYLRVRLRPGEEQIGKVTI